MTKIPGIIRFLERNASHAANKPPQDQLSCIRKMLELLQCNMSDTSFLFHVPILKDSNELCIKKILKQKCNIAMP